MTFWEIVLAVALGVLLIKAAPWLLLAVGCGIIWLLCVISTWWEKKP
ncbi:MAG: hypothetical protein LBR88_07560 [Zoogloeaceae bacterium]|jgi:hypothetical protein|nr:hypothetical protein [Zoogloeaceae bacterium]